MIIKTLLGSLSKKGFFHIFSSDLINKIITFGTAFILVHVLSKTLYGEWIYTMNNMNIFLLFSGLGVNNGILYYGTLTGDQNERQAIFRYGLFFGVSANIIMAMLIFCSTYVLPSPMEGSNILLRYLSLLPILYIVLAIIQAYLRANLRNKEYSFLNSLNSALILSLVLLGSIFFSSNGVICAYYLAYFISICFGLFLYLKKKVNYNHVYKLTLYFKKEFLRYSFTCSLTNGVSSVVYLIDVFLIGLIIKDESILASYKTATLIPFALNFLPLSIMTFLTPYFIKMSKEKSWIKKNYILMKKYLFIINLVISSTLFAFAPFIISVLFGKEYLDSIFPFRILSLGYFISGTFRIPNGNVIASIGKVKVNLVVAIVSSILNIVLDVVMISHYGAIGAAFSTLSIFIITSLYTELYLIRAFDITLNNYMYFKQ